MAAQTNAIAGIATIAVDGKSYLLSGNFKYSLGLYERDTKVGMDSVHGFGAKPKVPHIAATLRSVGTLDVKALTAMENVTIHAKLVNGKDIVGRNMWQVGEIEVDTQEGTFDVRFEGLSNSVEEVVRA